MGGGGGSVPSGVSVAVGDAASCGTGNQINPNIRVLMGLCPPSVTLSPGLRFTCGPVAANIPAPPLFSPPHLPVPLCGCCGVWYGQPFPLLLSVLMSTHFHCQFGCYDVCADRLCHESHWVIHYEVCPFSHDKHFRCPYPFLRYPHTAYHYLHQVDCLWSQEVQSCSSIRVASCPTPSPLFLQNSVSL